MRVRTGTSPRARGCCSCCCCRRCCKGKRICTPSPPQPKLALERPWANPSIGSPQTAGAYLLGLKSTHSRARPAACAPLSYNPLGAGELYNPTKSSLTLCQRHSTTLSIGLSRLDETTDGACSWLRTPHTRMWCAQQRTQVKQNTKHTCTHMQLKIGCRTGQGSRSEGISRPWRHAQDTPKCHRELPDRARSHSNSLAGSQTPNQKKSLCAQPTVPHHVHQHTAATAAAAAR